MAAAAAAAAVMAGQTLAMASLSLSCTEKCSSPLSSRSSSVCGLSLRPMLRISSLQQVQPRGRRWSNTAIEVAASVAQDEAPTEEKPDLEAFVKKALPGGFAAQRLLGTGRRKCAVARVCLVEGTGQVIINNRTAQDYLQGNPVWIQAVKYPLASLGYESKYDVIVKAHGGGVSAQSQAILLGVARALCVANQANRDPLKKQGLLTRDSRVVERKKYGLHKARKRPQYSKR